MPAPRYNIVTGGAVSLTGGAALSVLGAKAHANSGLLLLGYSVAFLGADPEATPALVEICSCTFGANGPGTNSTSVTPVQGVGRVLTAGFTAAKNWSAEPTTITVLEEMLITPNGGVLVWDYPLGTEYDTALAEGFVIRINVPANTSVRARMTVSRC